MNYNYLHYFSVLAELEHYTMAASRLGISQPSLSSAIRNLEKDLGGVKLFEKKGRNIRLTEEGIYYQARVNAALEELYMASRILKNSKDDAPIVVRVGFISGVLQGRLAKEIVTFLKEDSRVRFQLTESSSESLIELVRQEKIDMAIVDAMDRDANLHFKKLRQRDFYVALPEDHPFAQRDELDPREVMYLPQVVFNYDVRNSFREWASGYPTDESVVCQVNTVQAAIDLVAAGVGIAFIPDECVVPCDNVRFVHLSNWHQPLYRCILYDRWMEPTIWKFKDVITEAVKNPLG